MSLPFPPVQTTRSLQCANLEITHITHPCHIHPCHIHLGVFLGSCHTQILQPEVISATEIPLPTLLDGTCPSSRFWLAQFLTRALFLACICLPLSVSPHGLSLVDLKREQKNSGLSLGKHWLLVLHPDSWTYIIYPTISSCRLVIDFIQQVITLCWGYRHGKEHANVTACLHEASTLLEEEIDIKQVRLRLLAEVWCWSWLWYY